MQETFGHGSLFSVKELRIVRGERRQITFYAAARLDGLVQREEVFGIKLTEHFTGRDDNLIYRSATFGGLGTGAAGSIPNELSGAAGQGLGGDASSSSNLASQPLQSAAGYGLPGSQQQQQQQGRALPVVKVAQKFARNTSKPADKDVAKQVFYLAAGRIVVQYHHADDRLTAGHLVFHKDGPAQAVQASITHVVMRPAPPSPAALQLPATSSGRGWLANRVLAVN